MPNLGNWQQKLDWSLLPPGNVTASAAEQIPIGIKERQERSIIISGCHYHRSSLTSSIYGKAVRG